MNPISAEADRQIRQVLRDCGQLAEQMALKQFEVSEKGVNDYVTSIDIALDQQLTVAFSMLFPQDGVITEENSESRRYFTTDCPRLWCIDPLDGTEDFIQGKREYAVMVGHLQQQQPIAGWIYAPADDQLYFGGRDWGVFSASGGQDPVPLQGLQPPAVGAAVYPIVIGHRDQRNFSAAIERSIPEARFYSLGSFGLKVMEVVQGKAGLYIYLNGRVKVWDTAGPLAIARAAGLTCCDLEGRPISFAADDIDLATLTHKQPILVGWADHVEQLRPRLQQTIAEALQSSNRPSEAK